MKKKELIEHLIEVYETALIKTKKMNVHATYRYLSRNDLESGICYYIKLNLKIKKSAIKWISNSKNFKTKCFPYWFNTPHILHESFCKKSDIINTLKVRLEILKENLKTCK